jgi:Cytochrome b/b6/petB
MRLLQRRLGQVVVWIALLDLLVLSVTGIFLRWLYTPQATHAYNKIESLHTSIAFGLLARNLHRWSGVGFYVSLLLMTVLAVLGNRVSRKWGAFVAFMSFVSLFLGWVIWSAVLGRRDGTVMSADFYGQLYLRWAIFHPLGVVPGSFAVFGLWRMRRLIPPQASHRSDQQLAPEVAGPIL